MRRSGKCATIGVQSCRQGPNLGGVNLGICDDFSQTRRFPRLPSAHSVHRAKALRSGLELAIARATTKSFFAYDDVVDLQLKKTTAFLELEVDIRSGVERQTMLVQACLDRAQTSCGDRSCHARLVA